MSTYFNSSPGSNKDQIFYERNVKKTKKTKQTKTYKQTVVYIFFSHVCHFVYL